MRLLVSLLTEIKLKDNCGRLRTDDRVSEGVGLTVPDPITRDVEPSAKVTGQVDLYDWRLENNLELPVIWSVAPESMTHFEDEKIRYVLGLPDSDWDFIAS